VRKQVALSVAILVVFTVSASPALAGAKMKTRSWENSEDGFAKLDKQIRSQADRNLLGRRGVGLLLDRRPSPVERLADGSAGEYRGRGHLGVNGKPTVATFYLGEPKTIREIAVFSFNGDSRANQDYEVRWANNAKTPGKQPAFPKEPNLTTGDTVIGPDRGGFESRFVNDHGRPLAENVDWVEFRFWRTYKTAAGDPGKKKSKATSSACVNEIEVLGAKDDVLARSADEIAVRQAYAKLPKKPEFEKKKTLHETMIAAREELQRWELARDRMATYADSAILGDWHILGPIGRRDPIYKELKEATKIDLAKTYTTADGKKIRWEKREDLVDGKIHDLKGCGGADEKSLIYLCRPARFTVPLERKRGLVVQFHADGGRLQWLPARRNHKVQRGFALQGSGSEISEVSGDCQALMELSPDKEGRRRFYFQPQPQSNRLGAGQINQRIKRREELADQVDAMFADPVSRAQIRWERDDGIWGYQPRARSVEGWFPGHADEYLAPRYRAAIKKRLEQLEKNLAEAEGIKAMVLAGIQPKIVALVEKVKGGLAPELGVEELRKLYYRLAALDDTVAVAAKVRSMRLAVDDQRETFGNRYPEAGKHLKHIAEMEKKVVKILGLAVAGRPGAVEVAASLAKEIEEAGREILLANPLLKFDKLLLAYGSPRFGSNWGGANRIGEKMVVLSPVKPDGEITVIHEGQISDMDLHFSAEKVLFSDGSHIYEIGIDGGNLRQVTKKDCPVKHYDACYLPSGKIVCVSNACEQAVPCTGGGNVGNLHLIDANGENERRLTFDQDHDWNPTVMHDGRVLYTRWEYTDTPHYFSRLLFRMNPDGTGQMEYYGSNSYWPNASYWPRPIPGHPTMISCIVSGHHGVARVGEFLLLDPAKGRHEADGAVQKIPGYGKTVEPTMLDQLVTRVWPKFAAPYPLAEPGTNLGAGRYFLVCMKEHSWSTWDLCLADIYDNITPILGGGYMTPIPIVRRSVPPIIPDRVHPGCKDAVVYLPDIYQGPGLKDFPRGSIKRLRIGSHHFRYAGNGDTRASSLEGGWDVKKIHGTVPVREDGSAMFRVPANTPIFVQPLDEEGKAQQIMRSWFTAMPGEVLSCIGCHEKQNDVPPGQYNTAGVDRRPSEIEPWHGPTRGFSFDRELQPVLDRRCAGCHNGKPYKVAGTLCVPSAAKPTASQPLDDAATLIDLRAKRFHDIPQPDPTARKSRDVLKSHYSPAYIAMQQYVRRPGYEGDYHMPKPAEYEADTSTLVQMLKKGHYNVTLTPEEWERLYTWIDYNIPYPVNWRESHRPPKDDQVDRRVKYQKLYANIDDRDENPAPLPPVAKFEPPKPMPKPPAPVKLAGWPFAAEQAAAMQQAAAERAGAVEKVLDLGGDVMMPFVLVPAGKFVLGDHLGFPDENRQAVVEIKEPFYMGRFEVTNGQYALFDPEHNSGVINERWKDRSRRGTAIDTPELPVVRINWPRAMAFCRWLSEKTGTRCTLPTEAQWEWACRAGTATPYNVGVYSKSMKPFCNTADESARRWNHGRAEDGYNDGVHFTAKGDQFAPNAWGLYNMHGNVAEWCLSTYKPYPYNAADGRDNPATPGPKVVRGGSWNDLMRFATSASRWRYEPYKPVYNVGFRVVFPAKSQDMVARRDK